MKRFFSLLFSAFAVATFAQQPSNSKTVVVEANYLMGKFDPVTHLDFVTVGAPYTDKPGMCLRREAFEAFKRMHAAAKKDGVTLNIISSTRNFDRQKTIWEAKWNGTRLVDGQNLSKTITDPVKRALKILEYSSMPGTSRHHWGTDIDLNDLNNSSFEGNGKHAKVYQWLVAHAHEYGFAQVYTEGRVCGYQEEKWHWSYVPLSSQFLEQYRQKVGDSNITGFQGSDAAVKIQAVRNYVLLGVSKSCQLTSR